MNPATPRESQPPGISVDPIRAVAAYQKKVGELTNDVIMRDALIAELTTAVEQLRAENDHLRQDAPPTHAG